MLRNVKWGRSGTHTVKPGAKLPWYLDRRTVVDSDGVREEVFLSTPGRIVGWATLAALGLSILVLGVWHMNSTAHQAQMDDIQKLAEED